MGQLAQVGLALATSIGAWVNFIIALWFAARAGHFAADAMLRSSLVKLLVAGVGLAAVLLLAAPVVIASTSTLPKFQSESDLLILAAVGVVVYGALILALFGRRWLSAMRQQAQTAPGAPLTAFEGTSAPPAVPDEL
jgi:putative peptidoglycan lipid II flippase